MKQVNISKLMDEYQDNEFFPEGGSAAGTQAVKELVLAKVEPKKRRRLPLKTALIAAALAAVLVILMGAGFPSFVYELATGTVSFDQTAEEKSVTYAHDKYPVEIKDGRLWFVMNGERTDITDLVREDTPYLYDDCDPDTGVTHYLVVGGSLERCDCFEWVVVSNPQSGGITNTYALGSIVYDEQLGQSYCENSHIGFDAVHWEIAKDRPWLLAAAKELNIPFVDPDSGTDTIFFAP